MDSAYKIFNPSILDNLLEEKLAYGDDRTITASFRNDLDKPVYPKEQERVDHDYDAVISSYIESSNQNPNDTHIIGKRNHGRDLMNSIDIRQRGKSHHIDDMIHQSEQLQDSHYGDYYLSEDSNFRNQGITFADLSKGNSMNMDMNGQVSLGVVRDPTTNQYNEIMIRAPPPPDADYSEQYSNESQKRMNYDRASGYNGQKMIRPPPSEKLNHMKQEVELPYERTRAQIISRNRMQDDIANKYEFHKDGESGIPELSQALQRLEDMKPHINKLGNQGHINNRNILYNKLNHRSQKPNVSWMPLLDSRVKNIGQQQHHSNLFKNRRKNIGENKHGRVNHAPRETINQQLYAPQSTHTPKDLEMQRATTTDNNYHINYGSLQNENKNSSTPLSHTSNPTIKYESMTPLMINDGIGKQLLQQGHLNGPDEQVKHLTYLAPYNDTKRIDKINQHLQHPVHNLSSNNRRIIDINMKENNALNRIASSNIRVSDPKTSQRNISNRKELINSTIHSKYITDRNISRPIIDYIHPNNNVNSHTNLSQLSINQSSHNESVTSLSKRPESWINKTNPMNAGIDHPSSHNESITSLSRRPESWINKTNPINAGIENHDPSSTSISELSSNEFYNILSNNARQELNTRQNLIMPDSHLEIQSGHLTTTDIEMKNDNKPLLDIHLAERTSHGRSSNTRQIHGENDIATGISKTAIIQPTRKNKIFQEKRNQTGKHHDQRPIFPLFKFNSRKQQQDILNNKRI